MTDALALTPYDTFDAASIGAVELLHAQLGMGLWLVTRTVGDDWIVLQSLGTEPRYSVKTGDVLRWSDSFCSRMVRGEGPNIAGRADDIAAYREAPVGRAMPIGSYVGLPMKTPDGQLFGTLCAIDPHTKQNLDLGAPLLQTVGRLLATVLAREIARDDAARRAERAESDAMVDELTGLFNRRAWERFKELEEGRAKRLARPTCVVSIDLDGLKQANDTLGHSAGDDLIRRAASAIKSAVRENDVVARIGGDEIALILTDCVPELAETVVARIRSALADAKVEASMGLARREPASTLENAWQKADAAMYEEKRAHHGR